LGRRFRGTEKLIPLASSLGLIFAAWRELLNTGIGEVNFADLRSANRQFATLDYSDENPALYLGELVEFEELKLKNLRQFEGWS
jgi:hypothetical protein